MAGDAVRRRRVGPRGSRFRPSAGHRAVSPRLETERSDRRITHRQYRIRVSVVGRCCRFTSRGSQSGPPSDRRTDHRRLRRTHRRRRGAENRHHDSRPRIGRRNETPVGRRFRVRRPAAVASAVAASRVRQRLLCYPTMPRRNSILSRLYSSVHCEPVVMNACGRAASFLLYRFKRLATPILSSFALSSAA